MPPKPKEYEFRIDGEPFNVDDLTYSEQQEYRRLVRESSGDPELNPAFAEPMDKYPVWVYLMRRRRNPEYTLDEAKEVKPEEILIEVKPKRPTKAATKAA